MSKFVIALFLIMVCGLTPQKSSAQAAVYGDFSVTRMQSVSQDKYLSGATVGILLSGPKILGPMELDADAHGRFVHANNFSFDGITVGPRLSVPTVWGLRPYGEATVGFARIHNLADQPTATTDFTMELNGGIMKKITSHFDLMAEYSYAQYYAFVGEYTPKTYSIGAVYYFSKR